MNLSPDRSDETRRRIRQKHRAKLRERLESAERELRSLRQEQLAIAQDFAARMKTHSHRSSLAHAQVQAMLAELAGEEDTAILPILPSQEHG